MHVALVIMAAACFASCVWAIRSFFRRTGPMPLRMKLLGFTGLVGMAVHLTGLTWFVTESRPRLIVSLGLYLLGLGLLVWTMISLWRQRPLIAFSEEPAQRVFCRGPFAWFRHPFYLAYSLIWVAGAVAIPWFLGWPIVIVMLAQYAVAVQFEEKQFLRGDLESEYSNYRLRVGLLGPKFWMLPQSSESPGAARRG